MLAIVVLMQIYSPGPIFSAMWQVWAKGKLFRILKFRTTQVNDDSRTTPLGDWLTKYNLSKLPQLFNVLRGEMSFFGPQPLTLSEAVCSSLESQRRRNALRDSTKVQPVETRANQLDLAGYER
jgi:lipopolysaccharide/colanic/teichoic acid biosynthesis glycosyltransferase